MTNTEKPAAAPRLQYVVDHQVQSALLIRLGAYAGFFAFYFGAIQLFSMTMEEPSLAITEVILRFADEAIYWLPAVLLICPLVVHDMMKLSNRFAGPAFIVRREMKRLREGEPTNPVTFREGDYWADMAVSFNEIRQQILDLKNRPEPTPQLAPENPETESAALDEAYAAVVAAKEEASQAVSPDESECDDDLIGVTNSQEETQDTDLADDSPQVDAVSELETQTESLDEEVASVEADEVADATPAVELSQNPPDAPESLGESNPVDSEGENDPLVNETENVVQDESVEDGLQDKVTSPVSM